MWYVATIAHMRGSTEVVSHDFLKKKKSTHTTHTIARVYSTLKQCRRHSRAHTAIPYVSDVTACVNHARRWFFFFFFYSAAYIVWRRPLPRTRPARRRRGNSAGDSRAVWTRTTCVYVHVYTRSDVLWVCVYRTFTRHGLSAVVYLRGSTVAYVTAPRLVCAIFICSDYVAERTRRRWNGEPKKKKPTPLWRRRVGGWCKQTGDISV